MWLFASSNGTLAEAASPAMPKSRGGGAGTANVAAGGSGAKAVLEELRTRGGSDA